MGSENYFHADMAFAKRGSKMSTPVLARFRRQRTKKGVHQQTRIEECRILLPSGMSMSTRIRRRHELRTGNGSCVEAAQAVRDGPWESLRMLPKRFKA